MSNVMVESLPENNESFDSRNPPGFIEIRRNREGMQVGSHLDCAGNHLNTRMSTVKGFVNEAHLTGVEDTPSGKNDRLGDSEG